MTTHPEFTADGAYVYLSIEKQNRVAIFDASSLEFIKAIGDVRSPIGIYSPRTRENDGF